MCPVLGVGIRSSVSRFCPLSWAVNCGPPTPAQPNEALWKGKLWGNPGCPRPPWNGASAQRLWTTFFPALALWGSARNGFLGQPQAPK